ITPIRKSVGKFPVSTDADWLMTRPTRKSLSAKRADIAVFVMEASLGSPLKYYRRRRERTGRTVRTGEIIREQATRRKLCGYTVKWGSADIQRSLAIQKPV